MTFKQEIITVASLIALFSLISFTKAEKQPYFSDLVFHDKASNYCYYAGGEKDLEIAYVITRFRNKYIDGKSYSGYYYLIFKDNPNKKSRLDKSYIEERHKVPLEERVIESLCGRDTTFTHPEKADKTPPEFLAENIPVVPEVGNYRSDRMIDHLTHLMNDEFNKLNLRMFSDALLNQKQFELNLIKKMTDSLKKPAVRRDEFVAAMYPLATNFHQLKVEFLKDDLFFNLLLAYFKVTSWARSSDFAVNKFSSHEFSVLLKKTVKQETQKKHRYRYSHYSSDEEDDDEEEDEDKKKTKKVKMDPERPDLTNLTSEQKKEFSKQMRPFITKIGDTWENVTATKKPMEHDFKIISSQYLEKGVDTKRPPKKNYGTLCAIGYERKSSEEETVTITTTYTLQFKCLYAIDQELVTTKSEGGKTKLVKYGGGNESDKEDPATKEPSKKDAVKNASGPVKKASLQTAAAKAPNKGGAKAAPKKGPGNESG